MESLAQSWLVLSLTSSAFYLGLVPVAQFVPTIILSMAGGMVADRLPKRRVLMFTQFGAAMCSLIMSTLIFTGVVQLWMVYVIAAMLGTVNSIDTPTRQSFVSEMVAKDELVQAISLNSAVFNAGRLIGPAVAGIVLAAIGPAWCFLVNGLSFFAVIIQLSRMDETKLFMTEMKKAPGKMRDGFVYAMSNRSIKLTIITIAVLSTFAMNFSVWMPLLAKNTFDMGPGGFGLLMSMLGLGSLLGALCLAFIGKRRPPVAFIPITALLDALLLIALSTVGLLSAPVVLALVVLPLIGFVQTFTASFANSSVQIRAPDELRGRVLAFYFMIFNSGMPIGALITGVTAHRLGAPGSILLSASILAVAAIGVELVNLRAPADQPDTLSAPSAAAAD